jgi:enoyl-CoA hydratase/carnithine racemase
LAEDQPKAYVTRIENTFDTKEAQRVGLVTLSFLPEVLSQQIEALATSFCEKDALALQFTKETVAHVPSMTWDASVNFTAAKFAELKSRQAGETSTRAAAVASFLAGKTKPGKGA